MRREILFKAKRIDNGEWVEGWLFLTKDNTYIAYTSQFDDDLFLSPQNIFIAVDIETICQYTGLTDKNGNKIWENDVVKDTNIHLLGSVEYDEEHGMYVINEVNDGYQNFQEFWSCTEVIGNIFDNPELLKGGTTWKD